MKSERTKEESTSFVLPVVTCVRSEKFSDCWFDKSDFQGRAGWSIEAPYLTKEPNPKTK